MTFFHYYQSPLGLIRLESDDHALTALIFCDKADEEQSELPVFEKADKWLESYFRGTPYQPDFETRQPLTEFQRSVYQETVNIPYGSTVSYAEIARRIAVKRNIRRMSAQAVGQALGKNRLLLLMPCHRVIGADGSLGGFAGGSKLKENLLRHEGIII
ncbi:MAG: methylated-DNA--[Erysipelotrichaceae bacterium]|nr:methylated-DNA--[protein]-cysteine S-methyltransferase [Erysipelotrichaceae bacterium]